ncbi:MAG: hypothetical protein HYY03_03560 [Chloroflexi bacterium]|nr:hypothetical protein [Chloroflexota bacterium]
MIERVLYSRLMSRLPGMALLLALVASAVAVVACGDEAPPAGSPSPTRSPSTGTPSATVTTTPSATPFQGTRGPVEASPSPNLPLGGALLVDVRAARHEGFDRIVFEFQGGLPGYRIEYVQPPILGDASGLPITIEGAAFLRARFRSAAAHDPDTGAQTYTGPRELSPGLPSLVEAQETGDFEAILTWVLGLTEEADFQVYDLQDPYRIAIDVGHP